MLLSARRVGPTGKAYGLDMTDEMLALARENQRKAGVENVEFLKGEIEHIPLPDNSRRCHHQQLRHQSLEPTKTAFCARRSASSSRAAASPFPMWSRAAKFPMKSAATCSSGSAASPARFEESDYVAELCPGRLSTSIDIEPTRVYDIEDARTFLAGQGIDVDAIAPQVENKFMSAFIRAVKPASCLLRPGCCA